MSGQTTEGSSTHIEDYFRFFDVELSASKSEASRYITDIEGKLYYRQSDDYDSTSRKEIGYISANVVQVSHLDHDLFLDCDSHSADLIDVVSQMFDLETAEYVHDRHSFFDCCMYISHLKIDRDFRGKYFGLLALCDLIETLGYGNSVVLLKPHPPQFNAELRAAKGTAKEKEVTAAFKSARAKLIKYYRQIGFKAVKGTDYFVLDWVRFEKQRLNFE